MTNLPADPIDAGAGGPRRFGAGRLGWLFAGAAAIAGIAAVAILANILGSPNVGATPSAPVTGVGICTAVQVEATMASWEGAAGHRIGTLTIANTSTSDCALPAGARPSLVDRNGHDLIVGKASSLRAIVITAQTSVQTLVQTGNYCGPTAQEPAAVALEFGSVLRLVAGPAFGDASSGVPPCMGEAGPTDDITIQDWGAAQG
jgi:hypothetical protein